MTSVIHCNDHITGMLAGGENLHNQHHVHNNGKAIIYHLHNNYHSIVLLFNNVYVQPLMDMVIEYMNYLNNKIHHQAEP